MDATTGDRRWTLSDISALFDLPFIDLVAQANEVHRFIHWPNHVELADPDLGRSLIGMTEERADRIGFVHARANLPEPPEGVSMNAPVPVDHQDDRDSLEVSPFSLMDDIEFVRTVAVTRIAMPRTFIRLAAGRKAMSDTMQALCFLAGANSVFVDVDASTAANAADRDMLLFAKLGLSVCREHGAEGAYETLDMT